MTNQDTITAFLRGKGLTTPQIAGVEGNLKIESGFSPTAYNPGERAIGIAQWEGPRRTALQAYAKRSGTSETDLLTQLGFLWQELNTSEKGALGALRATSTPTAAAAAFDQRYERSSGEARSARESAATVIARQLGGAVDTSVGGLTGGSSSGGAASGPVTGDGVYRPGTGAAGVEQASFLSKATGVDYVLKGTRNLLLEGTAVVLAAALVGGGLYRLFGPQIKAATGAAKNAAGTAAMAAAL